MIPIRDNIASRRYPVVNIAIIAINVVVYLIQIAQGPDMDRFVIIYGLVPARYTSSHVAAYFTMGQQFFALFSFMFLHGGFWHLLGNMWSLYIFGDNIEDRMGPLRYLLFYLLCGLASGLSHLVLNPHSTVPTIGASGAIAGVMGAYFILHPRSRILTLIPILFIPWMIEIPAFFFLGFWFVLQFINATGASGGTGGIAWWAHIGGFLSGLIFLKLFTTLPELGLSRGMRSLATRKKSHRLQMIRPVSSAIDAHLHGVIRITDHEAASGSAKLVNVPWGYHKRLLRVTIPPGVRNGSRLRLKGVGRWTREGERGDLFLKVVLK
jgi:membrane associated rhomboid family serine protease